MERFRGRHAVTLYDVDDLETVSSDLTHALQFDADFILIIVQLISFEAGSRMMKYPIALTFADVEGLAVPWID